MPKVTVYSKDNCQPCRMVKRWLEREGVEYIEKDATEHIDYLSVLGYRQAPVTITEAGEHFYGFDIGKLQQIKAGS